MPETKTNYHHVPAQRKKKNAEIRTIPISKGIKALYDVKNKVIVTYLFDKDKFSMKESKKWVKDHKDNASYSQIALNYVLVDKLVLFRQSLVDEILKKIN